MESSVTINGNKIDTLVIPPHSLALGNFDGAYTQTGTYHKVSGFDTQEFLSKVSKKLSTKIDISFIGQINFAVGDDSMFILSQNKNTVSDDLKVLFNVCLYIESLATKKEHEGKFLSGSYREGSEGNKFLKDKWEKQMKDDLKKYYDGNWKDAYYTEKQKELRTKSKYKIWRIPDND